VLVFDWVMDLLSEQEKVQIFDYIKTNFQYDHKTGPLARKDEKPGDVHWYWNDEWNRHPQLQYPALAFAIAGDGIDDAWAQEVMALAYDEGDSRVLGPYGPNRGSGFLDVLMTLSLHTGGLAPTGYHNFFVEAVHPAAFWETAT
jgi:hypothetical protein